MQKTLFWKLIGFVLAAALAQGARAQLMAGAARVSITPDPTRVRYTLGGYGDLRRMTTPATGVHDTCYARALVLQDGGRTYALVSLDLCYVPANVKAAVVARVAGLGIASDELFLSATHTHSGPEPLMLHSGCVGEIGAMPHFDPGLLDWMAEHISNAIRDAAAHMVPADIGSAQTGPIGLNRNRRGEPGTDDELTELKVTAADGKPIAVVVNYAAHPTFFGADMLQVSGDWAGAFERMMEATLPGSVVLFLNGTEGDVSPSGADDGTPDERIETYACKLMRPTLRLLAAIRPEGHPKLDAWTEAVSLPEPKPHPFFLLGAALFHATRDQALALVHRMMPRVCQLSFLRLGRLLLMGFPGEPTTPIGLRAKQIARADGVAHPSVVALTNGWLGYLVTEGQYRAGKYEPTMSFYGPQIGSIIIDGVRRGLHRTSKEKTF
ncbi:MAG: neutral/alkaline non-lysosomal ceramidase N-terminal domain-containing protein [Chthonomonadales bacterium]